MPPDKKYVDYICIVSGKSQRHMLAIAEFVRRVYKKKCDIYDSVPKIEGESSKDWIALDLGKLFKQFLYETIYFSDKIIQNYFLWLH